MRFTASLWSDIFIIELVSVKNSRNATLSNIYKRLKDIGTMIQNGYKRMLKSIHEGENELWNSTYVQLQEEKSQLMDKLACINKADDEFYKQADLILKFCKNASQIFLKATPSQKRTICEIIGSNFKANAQNIDITMYPVFYDIIEMNRKGNSKKGRFELPETQTGTKKEPNKKALNLNGGTDEARTRDLLRDS